MKKEWKQLAINIADELYFVACSILVAWFIFHFQREKFLEIFTWICDFKDFGISLIFLTGIGIWAMILRLILTKIFILFYLLLDSIRTIKNKKKDVPKS